MSPTRRMIVLVLSVGALAAAAVLLPLETIPEAVDRFGPFAPVAGVAVGAALLVALVPRTPISIACGLLFGTVLGAICALSLAMIAATVTFAVGRVLGREFVIRKAGRHWRRLEWWIAREGVLAVAAVRAFPLGPYGLVGYAYGASGVRGRDYALGSILAGTPSAVTYAMLGAAIGGAGQASPLTLLPLASALVLATVVAARTRRHVLLGQRPVARSPVAGATGDGVAVTVER